MSEFMLKITPVIEGDYITKQLITSRSFTGSYNIKLVLKIEDTIIEINKGVTAKA
ncbi:hypothetical protein [Christiangramia salexigens]|uniref:hypothetical protein n=1 Tax=Christiangramia salexigens TaxID=1913577 RepID=UPI0012EBBEC9|nr:hypothetical protein [Christiangramia salexigens]